MMTDKNFKHIPGRDAVGADTGIRKPEEDAERSVLPDSDRMETGTYRFEFGSDETIYSVSFEGRITPEDIQRILEALHSQLYKNCPGAVRSYLEKHHLEFSHFRTEEISLAHGEIMNRAEDLLKSCCHERIDSHTDDTDNYYAVMDCQKWTGENCCEGCYYAVKRTTDMGICSYRIIAQTFSCDRYSDSQKGYFAIRAGDGIQKLQKLDESAGEPVLPAFGCVDMLKVLRNIDSIRTSRQAEKTAVK